MTDNGSTKTPAIILGLSPTGLYALRELAESGVPVFGVTGNRQCALYSKYIRPEKAYIIEADEEELLKKLCGRFEASPAKPILIPTSDNYIKFICTHAATLKKYFLFSDIYHTALYPEILDKGQFYAKCEKAALPYPNYWERPQIELETLKTKIAFPCLIKPSQIDVVKSQMRGKKVWIAENAAEYTQIISNLPEGETDWIVQQIVPGPESNIFLYGAYYDENSEPRHEFTARKLRQYPPGFGSASLVINEDRADIKTASRKFLKSIKFQGIAAIEYKYDETSDEILVIESNPRPSLWFEAAHQSGALICLALYNDLLTKSYLPESSVRSDVMWRFTFKDLYSKMFYVTHKNFILPKPVIRQTAVNRKAIFPVYSPSDPLPAFFDLGLAFTKLIKRLTFRRRSI